MAGDLTDFAEQAQMAYRQRQELRRFDHLPSPSPRPAGEVELAECGHPENFRPGTRFIAGPCPVCFPEEYAR